MVWKRCEPHTKKKCEEKKQSPSHAKLRSLCVLRRNKVIQTFTIMTKYQTDVSERTIEDTRIVSAQTNE